MSQTAQVSRLLRWYPAAWRERYGDELAALFEDTFETGPIPWRARVSTATSGLSQRIRHGLGADNQTPADQIRGGSLLVLCGWAFFVVAGSGYAKFNENWTSGTLNRVSVLPNGAYFTIEVAAAVGLLTVVVAGLIALPAVARSVRAAGWPLVRRKTMRVSVTVSATVLAGVPLVIWAHHLTYHQRNGGQPSYSALFLGVCLFLAATVAASTGWVVSVVRNVELAPRSLLWLGRLALVAALAMAVILGSLVTWWVSLARTAPAVLGGTAPLDLTIAGSLMMLGLMVAVAGARRVVTAAPRLHRD